jgi:outer membrane protein
LTPEHVSNLAGHYAAAGLNINFPIFNGHLFGARRAEADFKAQAAQETVRNAENQVARDVRLALLNTNTAYQRLELTAELLSQAAQALELAQARYNLGLGSIVELSQAQLNNTAAQIEQSSAKYEYQIQRAALDYEIGLRP